MMQTVDLKGIGETWEKAASAWFDAWMKSPAFLSAMGKMLSAQLGLKSSGNRLVDDALEMWRIPSGRDLESLAQRIASLEERLAAMEGKPAAAKDAAGAAKAEAK